VMGLSTAPFVMGEHVAQTVSAVSAHPAAVYLPDWQTAQPLQVELVRKYLLLHDVHLAEPCIDMTAVPLRAVHSRPFAAAPL
jgi:hypothetical protein